MLVISRVEVDEVVGSPCWETVEELARHVVVRIEQPATASHSLHSRSKLPSTVDFPHPLVPSSARC
jgi:hypothetical protein